jgi:hypothetical protein
MTGNELEIVWPIAGRLLGDFGADALRIEHLRTTPEAMGRTGRAREVSAAAGVSRGCIAPLGVGHRQLAVDRRLGSRRRLRWWAGLDRGTLVA